MTLVDSHCHIDDSQFDLDRDDALRRAQDAGIERLVVIGTGKGPPDLEAGIRLADAHERVYATVGIHPQYAARSTDDLLKQTAELAKHPKVLAIGEIGLDYHWQPFSPEQQRDVFVAHLNIARAAGKPVVIHTRDAWDDTIAILREHWRGEGCIMHCFTGAPEQAREALELGYYLSFSGIVTYPKAVEVHESAKIVPVDKLLVETDAPYLPPVPFRGKRNEPAYVVHTAARIAELRGEDAEAVARNTTANFLRLFQLKT